MISIDGFLAVYFSMRKPPRRIGRARPPAVGMATFAYGMHGGSFCARGRGLSCVVRVRRGRGGGVGGPRWRRSGRICRPSAGCGAVRRRAHGCQQHSTCNGPRAVPSARCGRGQDFLCPQKEGPLSLTASREQLRLAAPHRGVQSLLTCFGGLWYSVMAAFKRCWLKSGIPAASRSALFSRRLGR